MFILAHGFGGFSVWSLGIIALGSMGEAIHLGREGVMQETTHLMVARKQKERKNKGQDAKIPF
jgi:hypothetical protein